MSLWLLALAAQATAHKQTAGPTVRPPPVMHRASSPKPVVAAPADGRPTGPMAAPIEARPEDFRIPPSASVLAATLDRLRQPPPAPQHVHLTCIVQPREGVPVNCFPAAAIGRPATWQAYFKSMDAYMDAPATGTPAEEDAQALVAAATNRVLSSRLRPDPKAGADPKLMNFDMVVSPTDAQPANPQAKTIAFGEVIPEQPLDSAILTDLYPPSGMISRTAARVSITCLVRSDRSLLCRDKPEVAPIGADDIDDWLKDYFILASYQAASTLTLTPKAKDGSDVIGRLVAMNFRWQIPPDADKTTGNFVPAPVVRQAAIDVARRRQIKLPPVVMLPRERSLAILSHHQAIPALVAAQAGQRIEQSFRDALQDKGGGTNPYEKKYPGFVDAVAKAGRASIVDSLMGFETEAKPIVTADLAKLSDAQLAGLAAAKQPLITYAESVIQDSSKFNPETIDKVFDTPEAKRADDMHARYLDMLEVQPGGSAAIDAYDALEKKIGKLLEQRREFYFCQARAPVRKAAVAFLIAHGASANARLLDLSMKADEAAKPCVP